MGEELTDERERRRRGGWSRGEADATAGRHGAEMARPGKQGGGARNSGGWGVTASWLREEGRWRRRAERWCTAANATPRRALRGRRGRGVELLGVGTTFLAVATKEAAVLRGWPRDGDRG